MRGKFVEARKKEKTMPKQGRQATQGASQPPAKKTDSIYDSKRTKKQSAPGGPRRNAAPKARYSIRHTTPSKTKFANRHYDWPSAHFNPFSGGRADKRVINWDIKSNKGLTPHRKKEM